MDTFSTIRIKIKVAKKFRKLSKQIAKTHSEALEAMLNFFQWNDLSPDDDLGIKNNRTNKRINAVIAILKNIEKYQTLPTKTMLDTLFHEMSKVDEEQEEDSVDFGTPERFTRDTELEHYRNRHEEMLQQLSHYKNRIQELLGRLTYIKSTFGKGHYKLDMDKNDLENLKKDL
ncbi:BfmA/BtgA family mobilization protein [Tenacibaculum sp.]|uniref:BfmA/BtgA family mobilization protein n=1 Tax=Tenacibaculum sp. TaxID=1906242 RepID=UPI003D126A01